MIDNTEIDRKATEFEVSTTHVQKDYIFGWLLSGIFNDTNDLRDVLILKGGNGFRKAFFEHARYSSDLDFSTETALNPDDLHRDLNKACERASSKTGVTFQIERNNVQPKRGADADDVIYEARLYFKSFYGDEKCDLKVKLDVQEFDRVILPTVKRKLIHPYSDVEDCRAEIRCHSLEELLASKLKALIQRRHSPDLFDVVYATFFQNLIDVDRSLIARTFLQKTIYEPSPHVAKNLLLGIPFDAIKGFWERYIVCPKPSLMSFEAAQQQYADGIESLFAEITGINPYQPDPDYLSSDYRNILMEAGRLQQLVNMVYKGTLRVIEPYSLKYKITSGGYGREYLYAYDITGGTSGDFTIKTYTPDKIQSLKMIEDKFEPRYPVELSKSGTPEENPYFSKGGMLKSRYPKRRGVFRRTGRTTTFGAAIYSITCPICNKVFKRMSPYDTKLNKHKDEYGNQCYGTVGYLS